MANVFDVANWFLHYNQWLRESVDEDTDNITNLKLQKLLYYAQSAFLALQDEPLFDEEIYAWAHGPVVESVYQKYKKYGSSGINNIEQFTISDKEEKVLRQVYDTFGAYSAWGLRNLTHSESPWQETSQNGVIPRDKMKAYFRENYLD